MNKATDDDRLTEDQRREIFANLVELQDNGATVADSLHEIVMQFELKPSQVKAIEREGIDNDWPPLDE
jgi:hypothetical protein